MRLVALVALVMIAFAANSVLTRAGLVAGGIDVGSFGMIRLASGASVLLALCLWQRRRLTWLTWRRGLSVLGLLFYIGGFTRAYIGMESGLGALLLFGMVQVTMFGGAVILREAMPVLRVLGAAVAMGGLVLLVWPWEVIAESAWDVVAMAAAGVGWGLYSLAGRGSADPLADTAVNFVLAAALFPLLLLAVPTGPVTLTASGTLLAILSGAVTSGLGYALWYAVLPRLQASVAAVAQLTVPPIAALGGAMTLGETVGWTFVISALVILGGVALSVLGPAYVSKASSGS